MIVFPPLKRRCRSGFRSADAIAFSMDPGLGAASGSGNTIWRTSPVIDESGRGDLKALSEAKGLQDDRVVVVFTSDDGDTLGDHGQSQKWTSRFCAFL